MWIQLDGPAKVSDGLLDLGLPLVQETPVVVRSSVLGIEFDGLVIVADGLSHFPEVGVGHAPVVKGRGVVGL